MNKKYWSLQQIVDAYKYEHPEWTEEELMRNSEMIYKELNRSKSAMYRDNKKFYDHTVSTESIHTGIRVTTQDLVDSKPVPALVDFSDEEADKRARA